MVFELNENQSASRILAAVLQQRGRFRTRRNYVRPHCRPLSILEKNEKNRILELAFAR